MPIDVQREQIDHMIHYGSDNLRRIDPDIPFLKLFDRMIANGVSEKTAATIISEADLEGLGFGPKALVQDLNW